MVEAHRPVCMQYHVVWAANVIPSFLRRKVCYAIPLPPLFVAGSVRPYHCRFRNLGGARMLEAMQAAWPSIQADVLRRRALHHPSFL